MEQLNEMYDRIDIDNINIIGVEVKTNQRLVRDVPSKMCWYEVTYLYNGVKKELSVQAEYNKDEDSYGWYQAEWRIWTIDLKECIRRSVAWDLSYMETDLSYMETMEGRN